MRYDTATTRTARRSGHGHEMGATETRAREQHARVDVLRPAAHPEVQRVGRGRDLGASPDSHARTHRQCGQPRVRRAQTIGVSDGDHQATGHRPGEGNDARSRCSDWAARGGLVLPAAIAGPGEVCGRAVPIDHHPGDRRGVDAGARHGAGARRGNPSAGLANGGHERHGSEEEGRSGDAAAS